MVTDAEQTRQLRRLNFAGDREQLFRDHYEHRFVEGLRPAAWVVLFFFLLVRLTLLTFGLLSFNSLIGTTVGTLALGILLLCVYRASLHRYVHEATAFALMAIGTSFVPFWIPYLTQVPPVRASAGIQSVLLYLIILLFFTYTLSRLRFVYAATVGMALSGFYLVYVGGLWGSGALSNRPMLSVGQLLSVVFTVNLMGLVASYWTERYARRDFLLSTLLERERDRSENLLRNILPAPIADRLKDAQHRQVSPHVVDSFAEVTVLFADIVGFTTLSTSMTPEALVGLLNDIFSAFDALAEKHGLEKIKTIGDAYMVVAGLPTPRPDHAVVIAEMALDLQTTIGHLGRERGLPLSLRIGLNCGPVVAGVIGTKKFIYDLWGDTVNTASRMESHGEPGEIQLTPAMADLLREKYRLEERGIIALKGRGEIVAYRLKGRLSDSV